MTQILPFDYCKVLLLPVFLYAHSVCSSQEKITGTPLSSQATKENREYGEILQFVKIPTPDLPKYVQLVEKIRTAPLAPISRNPEFLVEPRRMQFIAMFFGILDKPDLEAVSGSVVAIYQENNPAHEIGVYGLYFSDQETAKMRFKKLANGKKDSPFILKGSLLLYIWRDGGVSDLAFNAIRDYFTKAKFQLKQ